MIYLRKNQKKILKRNLGKNSQFWLKNRNFGFKNRNFGYKNRNFSLKIAILVKNRNFGYKIASLVNPNVKSQL